MLNLSISAHEARVCQIELEPYEPSIARLGFRLQQYTGCDAERVNIWLTENQLRQIELTISAYFREKEGKTA